MDLEPWQAGIVHKKLFPGLNYLLRLRDRLAKVAAPDDPLLQMVRDAYDASWRLSLEMHYRSCAHGVGKESVKTQTDQAPPAEPLGDFTQPEASGVSLESP